MWYLFLLLPPILFAAGNILDKFLTQKIGNTVASVVVMLSGLFGIFVSLAIFLFNPIFGVSAASIILMMLSSILSSLSVFFYIDALRNDSVLSVAPAMQLGAIFGYILDIFVFDSNTNTYALIGCSIVLISSLMLTLRIEKVEGKDRFDLSTFFKTSLSSLFLATSGAMFKFFSTSYGYWTVQFYEYLGIILIAIFFILASGYRSQFKYHFRKNKFTAAVILIYILTECVMILGDLSLNFASTIAPLVQVFSINSIQPVILFVVSFLLLKIFPKFDIDVKRHAYNSRSILTVGLIAVGTLMVVIFGK